MTRVQVMDWLRGESKPEGEEVEPDPGTHLYSCSACHLTFIGVETGECPQCDGELREVPTGDDLGFGATGD